jgi:hypothetical protein
MTALTHNRLIRKLHDIEGEIIAHNARRDCQWCRDSIMSVTSQPCEYVREKVAEARAIQKRINR